MPSNDSDSEITVSSQGQKRGRPSYKKVIAEFLAEIRPQLDEIKELKSLKKDIGELTSEVSLLKNEIICANTEFKKLLTKSKEQDRKINLLEKHIDSIQLKRIKEERRNNQNILIVRGNNLKENNNLVENISKVVPCFPPNPQISFPHKNICKLSFPPQAISFEKRKEIFNANYELKNKYNMRIDCDKSYDDRQMSGALLKMRYELKTKNPNTNYKIFDNKLQATNGDTWTYSFLTEQIQKE